MEAGTAELTRLALPCKHGQVGDETPISSYLSARHAQVGIPPGGPLDLGWLPVHIICVHNVHALPNFLYSVCVCVRTCV
eukprot:1139485-Pelagomonas_calceolata.AAC.12